MVLPPSRSDYHSTPLVPSYHVRANSTWQLDESIISPRQSLPMARHKSLPFKRRQTPPEYLSQISPKNPSLSPSLRAAALGVAASPVANGAGRAAVGFLRGCLRDDVKESERIVGNASWSCLNQCEKVWAAGEGEDFVQLPRWLDEKDIVPPSSPSDAADRPNHRKLRNRASAALVNVKEENERCSCCNKEDFWVCFDVFQDMDRRQEGAVRRGDFVWALSAHGTSVEFQRVVRRARLSAYFKSTAREISLEEYLRRIFPNMTATDFQKMQRWAGFRKAHKLLTSAAFQASHDELQKIFSFLESDSSSGTISVADLIRAQILSLTEILAIVPSTSGPDLRHKDYCEIVNPALVRKYGSEECQSKYLGLAPTTDWEDSVVHHLGADKLASIRHDSLLDMSDIERESSAVTTVPVF